MLPSFVEFSLKRNWLTENIAEDIEAPKGSTTSANKSPFTKEEMTRIYAACDKLGAPIPVDQAPSLGQGRTCGTS